MITPECSDLGCILPCNGVIFPREKGVISIKKIMEHESSRKYEVLKPGENIKITICPASSFGSSDCSSSSSSSDSSSSSSRDCASSSGDTSGESKSNCKLKCDLDSSHLPSGAVLNSEYQSSMSSSDCSSSGRGSSCGGCPGGYAQKCIGFRALITPLSELVSYDGEPLVGFDFKRKAGVVTMSIQPFVGVISNNGVSYLLVQQKICDLPREPKSFTCRLTYNGLPKVSFVQIDPVTTPSQNIKIYLDISGSPIGNIGDTISFDGFCCSWITYT